jgi:hypothetical protein
LVKAYTELSPWKAALIGIFGGLIIAVPLALFGKLAFALPAIISLLVVASAVLLKWELRRQAWFWACIAAVAALHVAAIIFVPWSTKWVPGPLVTGIGGADLFLVLAVITYLDRHLEDHKSRQIHR